MTEVPQVFVPFMQSYLTNKFGKIAESSAEVAFDALDRNSSATIDFVEFVELSLLLRLRLDCHEKQGVLDSLGLYRCYELIVKESTFRHKTLVAWHQLRIEDIESVISFSSHLQSSVLDECTQQSIQREHRDELEKHQHGLNRALAGLAHHKEVLSRSLSLFDGLFKPAASADHLATAS